MASKISAFIEDYSDRIYNKYCRTQMKKYSASRRSGTSVSDDADYPVFCYLASQNDKIFKRFKRNEIYNNILEHLTEQNGTDYLNIVNAGGGAFPDSCWENFRKNDSCGSPRMFYYNINGKMKKVSPTTLRYVKVLKDIISLLDTENIGSAAEIGIGYGGQGRILTSYLESIKTYYLFDLPEVLKLSEKYLKQFGDTSKFRFIDGTDIKINAEYDLVISNYAFSELVRAVQDIYLEKVILKSRQGYITWNSISCDKLDGYSVEELLKKIPGSFVIPEEPLTSENNCIIVWKG